MLHTYMSTCTMHVAYLAMCTLIVDLSQQPIHQPITWEEDRIIFSRLLFELNCNGHQLFAGVDVEEADWCTRRLAFPWWQSFKYLQVTDVHMTSLCMVIQSNTQYKIIYRGSSNDPHTKIHECIFPTTGCSLNYQTAHLWLQRAVSHASIVGMPLKS